ncbi:hypothetical protein ONZ45_g5755 [Pleurotus djamor]|nr:hypothetical protein ONZ45_g5755 [Pleurotus djamor]
MSAPPPPSTQDAPKSIKKRKLTDKSIPNVILQSPAFAEDSRMYQDLLEMERKLDWTIMRKKAEIQDALARNPTTTRTLRLFVSHSTSGQVWQNGGDTSTTPNFDTGEGVPAWMLRIDGRLLEPPNVRSRDKIPVRKFSTLIKRMVVEMDRDPAMYQDSNIVEWPRAPGHQNPILDGFTIRRTGDVPTKIRIILFLEHFPEQFKVTPELGSLLGIKEESRVGVIQALWNYIKVQGLQDKTDRRLVRADDALRPIFGADALPFQKLPELVNRYLTAPDPVIVHYILNPTIPPPERPSAWDVEVKMEDHLMKGKMTVLLQANKESAANLAKLDEEIALHAQSLHNSHLKRTFLESFANDPAQFIQTWLESQSRDLESILGAGATEYGTVRAEELKRSEFFRLPWVEEAVALQEGLRISKLPGAPINTVPMVDPNSTNVVLFIISSAAMIAGLGANIQNPAIQQMEEQLPATSSQISLSLSLFILSQGVVPLIWSAISEIKGRKLVYLVSVGLATVGCIVTALASNIGLVIGFRVLQGAGSSSVISIGAATLADLYPPAIRGTKMGIYYTAPLLGPSLGPILGGALTVGFSWRACFWFMTIFCGISWLSFLIFFKDTWRKERSLTYQNILRAKLRELDHDDSSKTPSDGNPKIVSGGGKTAISSHTSSVTEIAVVSKNGLEKDLTSGGEKTGNTDVSTELPDIKLTFKDINPIRPISLVLRRINNLIILLASGSFFAFSFLITYTTSRTLGNQYHYDAFKIGLVLLAFGIGSLAGSLIGGRYSDYTFRKLKDANGGQSSPEMRLKSTFSGLLLLPPSIVGYAWVTRQHVHISAMCIMLFLNGFLSIYVYASTLAYIVDANNGRSSTAMACNSAFRGFSAFVVTEIAVPLQDAVGDEAYPRVDVYDMVLRDDNY